MPENRKELDAVVARRILDGLGRTDANSRFDVRPLGGGVSSTVLLIENGHWRHVLKQPLHRFRVRDEWTVDTSRTRVEFKAVKFFESKLGPEAVVPAITFDEAQEVLVLEAVPIAWTPWKERLLAGEVRPELGKRAAELLLRLHRLTADLGPDDFRNDELFRQQRLHPYFVTSSERHAETADELRRIVGEFGARGDLVHGDFSPKNLVTNGFDLRLLDHEVVTRGDGAFDVAFLLNHLLLKMVHAPRAADELRACAESFWTTYKNGARDMGNDLEARTVRFLGALQIARAVGKSRAEYLSEPEREVVEAVGTSLLKEHIGSVRRSLDRVAVLGPSQH